MDILYFGIISSKNKLKFVYKKLIQFVFYQ